MSNFPTLNRMGINNPQEIDRYSLQTVGNVDLLRIVYRRQKGSLLPASKRFRFERVEKLQLAEGDHRAAQVHYEISPFARDAVTELDQVVRAKREHKQQLAVVREELQRMKEETDSRLAYIESLLKDLDG